jgi:hypothetical protein
VTPQQLFGELVPKFPAFSLTEHVGGKLRALYDDDAHPLPDRLTLLVAALDADAVAN